MYEIWKCRILSSSQQNIPDKRGLDTLIDLTNIKKIYIEK